MDTVTLGAIKREKIGTRASRAVRREGRIPAILYGHGMEPLSLEVDKLELFHALHTKAGENVVIQLDVKEQTLKESTCRIKSLQHDPVTDEVEHVDFTVISLKEKIEVEVPLETKNADEALGVKEGGILDITHHEILIECLPTQIPEVIEIDVKEMKIGDILHVSDLQMPEGAECQLDPEDVLISLHPPKVQEEEAEEEAEEGAQPEVIEKGKKEDAEGDGGDAGESKE